MPFAASKLIFLCVCLKSTAEETLSAWHNVTKYGAKSPPEGGIFIKIGKSGLDKIMSRVAMVLPPILANTTAPDKITRSKSLLITARVLFATMQVLVPPNFF